MVRDFGTKAFVGRSQGWCSINVVRTKVDVMVDD